MTSKPYAHDIDAEEGVAGRSRLWWLLPVLGVLFALLLVVWWPGCRQYPAVSSKESLYLMKLLYTACNTRDEARLAKVERDVEAAARAGKLPPAEQEAFGRILGLAKAGKWADAERAAFKFAQDQVGQGHPAADEPGHGHETKPVRAPKR